MKISNFKDGFTFIELLIVVAIILIAFVGVFILLNKVIYVSKVSVHKLTASMLAQEGIEITRNIRETNWVQEKAWNEGLSSGDYIAQYDSLSLQSFEDKFLILNPRVVLYGYDEELDSELGIVESLFKRRITISDNPDGDPQTEDIAIVSEVTWDERGRPQSILLEDRLYDWRSRQ